jgi:hypothetical protein
VFITSTFCSITFEINFPNVEQNNFNWDFFQSRLFWKRADSRKVRWTVPKSVELVQFSELVPCKAQIPHPVPSSWVMELSSQLKLIKNSWSPRPLLNNTDCKNRTILANLFVPPHITFSPNRSVLFTVTYTTSLTQPVLVSVRFWHDFEQPTWTVISGRAHILKREISTSLWWTAIFSVPLTPRRFPIESPPESKWVE